MPPRLSLIGRGTAVICLLGVGDQLLLESQGEGAGEVPGEHDEKPARC
jgi:hypothetical protein